MIKGKKKKKKHQLQFIHPIKYKYFQDSEYNAYNKQNIMHQTN